MNTSCLSFSSFSRLGYRSDLVMESLCRVSDYPYNISCTIQYPGFSTTSTEYRYHDSFRFLPDTYLSRLSKPLYIMYSALLFTAFNLGVRIESDVRVQDDIKSTFDSL